MKKNMGNFDRIIRLIIALGLSMAWYLGYLEGTLGIIGLVIALVFILTVLMGFCPLYTLVGISSCKVKQK